MARVKRVKSMSERLLGERPSASEMLSFISKDSKNVTTLDDIEIIPSVPTVFTSFNRAVVLRGAPGGTTWLVHGEPGGGKSVFSLGICNSFVNTGNVAGIIDAEYAMEKRWIDANKARKDGILYHRPLSLEDAFETTDIWINNFAKAKKDGKIPEETMFAIVVDTIHKMACKQEIADLRSGGGSGGREKHGSENLNKGWGMRRANVITTWLDYLTPLVSKHRITFIALAHEKETKPETWGSPDYKVKGGKSLIYEAMVRVRISQGKKIFVEDGKKKIVVGQEHHGQVIKNKVGHPYEYFKFFTSNGKGDVPAGLDHIQEAICECEYRNAFHKSGAWLYLPYDHSQKFQGENNLKKYFIDNPEAFVEFVEYLNDSLDDPSDYSYNEEKSEEYNEGEADENGNDDDGDTV